MRERERERERERDVSKYLPYSWHVNINFKEYLQVRHVRYLHR